MIAFNLGVRFLAELAGIAALAVWGYRTPSSDPWKVMLAVAAPAVLIVFWGRWIAPKSTSPLSQRIRMLVGSVLLLATALLLAISGYGAWAAVFAVVVVLNTAVLATRPEGTSL